MAGEIEILAEVLQSMIEECLRDIRGTHVFQLGGRGNRAVMGMNSSSGVAALMPIDSLPGGFFLNYFGQFTTMALPPPHEITDPAVLRDLRDTPGRLIRSTLQGPIHAKLAESRPDFHMIIAYLLHKPEPYLDGWRMELATGRVSQVTVRVIGKMDWE